MKKLLSILVMTALVLSSLALAISATGSPTGEITKADEAEPTVVDKDGNAVTEIADGEMIKVTDDDEAEHIPESDEFAETFGEKYADYKAYGAFHVTLTDHGKAIVKDGKLTGIKITITVPGLSAANAPTVYYHDVAHNKYIIVESTVEGNKITFTALPLTGEVSTASVAKAVNALTATVLSATADHVISDTDIGYYGIIYTGAATSPSTGVPTAAFVIVLVVALAGAAFAGKKIFAK